MTRQKVYFLLIHLALVLLPQFIFACEKCFGAKDNSSTTQGIGFAMLLLLTITAMVLGSIVAFFIYMARRIRKVESGEILVTDKGYLLTHPGLVREIRDSNG